MNRRMVRPACVATVFCLLLCGCGDPVAKTAPVRGKVIFKGKGVPNGTVNFIPEGGGTSATGKIQPDGSFTLTTFKHGDGAILGKHKIVIVAMQDMKDTLPEARSPLPPPIVQMKYTSPATTTLFETVEDKENNFTLDLKD